MSWLIVKKCSTVLYSYIIANLRFHILFLLLNNLF